MHNRYLKGLGAALFLLIGIPLWGQLPMGGWKIHLSYTSVSRVEQSAGKVYGLSNGALFSVDKETEEVEYYSKLTGLSSMDITYMKYDAGSGNLLLFYSDGNIDLLNDEGDIRNISDLYLSQMNGSKQVNDVLIIGRQAFLAMDFGIIVLNLQKWEIADTYYIGEEASSVSLIALAADADSIYAASSKTLYSAPLKAQLIDYNNWKRTAPLPNAGDIRQIVTYGDTLCMLRNQTLYLREENGWRNLSDTLEISSVSSQNGRLMLHATSTHRLYQPNQAPIQLDCYPGALSAVFDTYTRIWWFATGSSGIGKYTQEGYTGTFSPSGPVNNLPYRLRMSQNRLYMVPGGYRDALFLNIPGEASIYENGRWRNYATSYFSYILRVWPPTDFCDIISVPIDKKHFYIASGGYGLIEFRDDLFYAWHMPSNSPLEARLPDRENKYTWVESLATDSKGNLWMYNTSHNGLKMLTPEGTWYAFNNQAVDNLFRVKDLLILESNENIKILSCFRDPAGIGIMDDNGTYDNPNDDRANFTSTFIDQRGNSITPGHIWCSVLDMEGALWIGTNSGVLCFPQPENLFHSNACQRITMRRNDGTNLLDYLLDNETIYALAVDGKNRLWIGTETSGLYLMDIVGEDAETIHHFTTDNSPLPSNTIQSIAINKQTGEVFIGTGKGLVSYQSDAAEPSANLQDIYAYPNPVRHDFEGLITIAGLTEDSYIKILDQAGNLVCETRSNGGLATWDRKDISGRLVTSGVYLIQCVSSDGHQFGFSKILIMK